MMPAITLNGLTPPPPPPNAHIHYFAIYFSHKQSRLLKFVEML